MTSRLSQQNVTRRSAHAPRRVMVPDRTVKRSADVAPIVNIQSAIPTKQSTASQAIIPRPAATKRRPVKASKVHVAPWPGKPKYVGHRIDKPQKASVADDMRVLLVQHNHLPKHLARTANRAQLLADVIAQEQNVELPLADKEVTLRRLGWKKHALHVAAVVLVVASVYASIDTWITNRTVEAQYEKQVKNASDDKPRQTTEGKDESKVSRADLASHSVPAEHPRALYINKLNVSARIQPMGVNGDGSLQAPQNIFDAGWYTESIVPSKGGAVVIDGHASGPTRLGLFAYLDTLQKDDIVTIETGDRTRYTYKVVAKETVDRTKVDMQKLMLPYGNNIQGANFITCSGEWEQADQTYTERTIVYTKLIQ